MVQREELVVRMYNGRTVSPVVIVAFLVTSCASYRIDQGIEAFNRGDYSLAAHHWNGLAQAGHPDAENNVGVLWEYGLGKTPKNLNQAAEWYLRAARKGHLQAMTNLARVQKQLGYQEAALSWLTLAARWGHPNAIAMLRQWNEPVPSLDLLENHLAEKQRQRQEIGDALGAMVLLGLAGAVANSRGTTAPVNSGLPPMVPSGGRSGSKTSRGCMHDFDCTIGYKCIKAPLANNGVCMQPVDADGIPTLSVPGEPRPTCYSIADCPVGFRCDTTRNVCVK